MYVCMHSGERANYGFGLALLVWKEAEYCVSIFRNHSIIKQQTTKKEVRFGQL